MILCLIRKVRSSRGHVEEVCRHQKLQGDYLFTSLGLKWVEIRLILCLGGEAYATTMQEQRGIHSRLLPDGDGISFDSP